MNWKQELAKEIYPILEVNSTPATLSLYIDLADNSVWATASKSSIATVKRQLLVKSPEKVTRSMIDDESIVAGDRYIDVAFVVMKEAVFYSLPGDPYMPSALSTLRPFTPSNSWGLKLGSDTLTINGEIWTIIKIEERQILDAEPAVLRLFLRRQGKESEATSK